MLGTPPAFILSQDQTLNKLYLKPVGLKSIYLIAFQLSKELFQSHFWLLQEPFSGAYLHKLFLTLFNFQGTRFAARLSAAAYIDYHGTIRLSRTFFDFPKNLFPLPDRDPASLSSARLIYHRISRLSTAFLRFFKHFLRTLHIVG